MINQNTQGRTFRAGDQLDRVVLQDRSRIVLDRSHDQLLKAKDKPGGARQAADAEADELIRNLAAGIARWTFHDQFHLRAPERRIENKSKRIARFPDVCTEKTIQPSPLRFSYHLPLVVGALCLEKTTLPGHWLKCKLLRETRRRDGDDTLRFSLSFRFHLSRPPRADALGARPRYRRGPVRDRVR